MLEALGPFAREVLPSESLKTLVAQIRHTIVRNALQKLRLQQLLEACAGKDVPVMLVKGLWLVHCVYGDVAARDSGDIDLLMHPCDVQSFTALAQSLGFEMPVSAASPSADGHAVNEFTLQHSGDGLVIDVHWSLTNPFTESPLDEDLLWERSELADLGGVMCRTLNLEDHLLYLCFHAAVHHRFCDVGPRCLHDVAMVIRKPPRPIRWDGLVGRAHVLGWERAAWLMFSLVEEHLGVPVPARVMQDLHRGSPYDKAVRQRSLEAIFAREENSLYRLVARLAAPQPAGRVTAIRQLLFPPGVHIRNQFGAPAAAATWPLHVRRLARKVVEWAPEVGALLVGSRTHREGLARTLQIERWLAGKS